MPFNQFLEAVRSRTEDRFELQTTGSEVDMLHSLASELLTNRKVIRLRRPGNENSGWRTFLVVALESSEHIPTANRWAAEVRDSLLDPETADLYLFLLVDGITVNVSLDIEASELFCRKFVIRQDESVEELLNRTFLTQIFSHLEGVTFTDPLQTALFQTGGRHAWFSDQCQVAWRSSILSGKSGSDIAEDLLSHIVNEEVPK